MHPRGSTERKLYDRPGKRPTWPEPDDPESHLGSPRRRGLPGIRGGDNIGGTKARPYQPRPSDGLPNVEISKPKREQWMEYFSAELNCTMKYNPVTGETRRAKPNQADLEVSPASNFEGAGKLVEQSTVRMPLDIPRTPVDNEARSKPIADDNRPSSSRLQHSHQNHTTGAPVFPSSLPASHVPSRAGTRSGSLPRPVDSMDEKDRPVTVRDMERFTEAIQATIREMNTQFIKAIADLYKQEEDCEAEIEKP